MNKTFYFISLALTLMGGLLFSSCDDEPDELLTKPTISDLEVGLGNSLVGYIGGDLHIEAEIVAEGLIDMITVEIHQEEGSSEEIEMSYDEFAGLRNTTFHEHIDIPAGTEEGEYHFHLTVTDKEGNQTTVEVEIRLEELEDTAAPEITITSSPENKTYAKGTTVSISGTIADNVALAGLFVALVKESDNIADDDVSGSNKSIIPMLHTHTFTAPASHPFTASIVIGAENDNNMTPAVIEGANAWRSGNYYLLVRSKDAKNNWATSARFPVVLQID